MKYMVARQSKMDGRWFVTEKMEFSSKVPAVAAYSKLAYEVAKEHEGAMLEEWVRPADFIPVRYTRLQSLRSLTFLEENKGPVDEVGLYKVRERK